MKVSADRTETTEVQCNGDTEMLCTQPFHWDDGVPYCDTCGLFRATIASNEAKRRRAKNGDGALSGAGAIQ